MTREQKFFLQVLADHIHGRATNPPEGLDWPQIAKYAKSHEVEGIVYHQCKDYLTQHEELAAVNKRLSKASAAAMFYYANRTAMVEQIKTEFKQHEIEFFTVKGDAVAPLYPVPMLRTMGDTDFVIHTEDRQHAYDIMLQLGYENRGTPDKHEWPYYKNKMEMEIHNCLIYPQVINKDGFEEYFNDFWKYVKNGELDWGFHFMFLLLHLRKHFMNSGVGFRQFMDLVVVANAKCDAVDWPWVENELKQLGLIRFAENCFGFCERWFGTRAPLPVAELEDDFFNSATKKIFIDGIFGFENEENRRNVAINEARTASGPNIADMFSSALRKAFPSYRSLIATGHYPFLMGRPLMLPIAWIYRIFFRGIMLGRTSLGIRLLSNSFTSKEAYDKRNDMLNKWGL